jgi:hypothetical protein
MAAIKMIVFMGHFLSKLQPVKGRRPQFHALCTSCIQGFSRPARLGSVQGLSLNELSNYVISQT